MTTPEDPRYEIAVDAHGEWDALAVGWAMSALDWEDEERFAQHLPGCARCTATVRETLYTVADLAYALPDEAPPPSLKQRLMAAVAVEPQDVTPSASTAASPVLASGPIPVPGFDAGRAESDTHDWFTRPEQLPNGSIHPIEAAPADSRTGSPTRADSGPAGVTSIGAGPGDRARSDSGRPGSGRTAGPGPAGELRPAIEYPRSDGRDNVVPLQPRRRRALTTVAAAAAVVLIAALAVWNVQLRSQRNDLQQVTAQRDRLQQIVSQRDAAIRQLTANGPARIAAMTETGAPSQAREATLVVSGNRVEIIVESLGATKGTESYWLWTLNCDTGAPTDLRPIKGFTISQSEFSVRDIGSSPGVSTATCFALSSETISGTPIKPHLVVAVGQPK